MIKKILNLFIKRKIRKLAMKIFPIIVQKRDNAQYGDYYYESYCIARQAITYHDNKDYFE